MHGRTSASSSTRPAWKELGGMVTDTQSLRKINTQHTQLSKTENTAACLPMVQPNLFRVCLILSLVIAFKSFSSVFHYVEENCTHSQSGPEVYSATWTTVTGHSLYYDHDHEVLKPHPTAVSGTATACKRKEITNTPRKNRPSAHKAAHCLFFCDAYNPYQ